MLVNGMTGFHCNRLTSRGRWGWLPVHIVQVDDPMRCWACPRQLTPEQICTTIMLKLCGSLWAHARTESD